MEALGRSAAQNSCPPNPTPSHWMGIPQAACGLLPPAPHHPVQHCPPSPTLPPPPHPISDSLTARTPLLQVGYFLPLPIILCSMRSGIASGWKTMTATAFLLVGERVWGKRGGTCMMVSGRLLQYERRASGLYTEALRRVSAGGALLVTVAHTEGPLRPCIAFVSPSTTSPASSDLPFVQPLNNPLLPQPLFAPCSPTPQCFWGRCGR